MKKVSYAKYKGRRIIAGNNYYELELQLNGNSPEFVVLDKTTEQRYADGDYSYYLKRKEGKREIETHTIDYISHLIKETKQGKEIILTGEIDKTFNIIHRFFIFNEPYFEEAITLSKEKSDPVDISYIGCGFTKRLSNDRCEMVNDVKNYHVVAIPYRRNVRGRMGEYEDFSIEDLLTRRGYHSFQAISKLTDERGSEGWVLTDDSNGMVIIKYSQDQVEYSLLGLELKEDASYLRFGGCGIWCREPDINPILKSGKEINFGTTRYQFIRGGWKEGCYLFRSFMDAKGHTMPKRFNPPVHWNELYDNPFWWKVSLWPYKEEKDYKRLLQKYYLLKDMEFEAAKAKEIGCEALYLDPGWDTSFASSIWDTKRLGKLKDFVKLMKKKYNLDISLHTPLAVWCDASASAYPREADRMDEKGKIIANSLCSGSSAYLDTKKERLLKLLKEGTSFLMFDGANYTGTCCNPDHGHPIPYTKNDHCKSYLKFCQDIHREYPKVLIEMHEMVLLGIDAPIYYLHALPFSYDEHWAFEFMWDTMDDILSGRAISLYYYNLAYNIPLYLHIDLRKDNINCLMFWWYASTCRHLGIGGRHYQEVQWEAHKEAMSQYLRLKRFYTQGIFYGLEEDVHVHTLDSKAVFNIFNLSDKPIRRKIVFKLEEIGLSKNRKVKIKGVTSLYCDGKSEFTIDLPSRSHELVEIV